MTENNTKSKANPMWGGHFASGPAEVMTKINASIGFDCKLYRQDIRASLAHAAMLEQQKILTSDEVQQITQGLLTIEQEIENSAFTFSEELEDIHMNIEARLRELIGDTAGKLHTARSRNDQVATDFKLWMRDTLDATDQQLQALQAALIKQAETHADTVMPGFTHLQVAQPVTFGHHLLAYVEMLGRDRGRLSDCRTRLNECPLGAAALAGTSFPIDREATAKALGFDKPTANSLDTVSDRDFALEALSALSILATHLSRLAEELVNWCSAGFSFITLPHHFTTGSSIMPQKRNPDGAELVRAKSGRVIGALIGLLTVMKGLPLAYSKDMQEDKEPVFEAFEQMGMVLSIMEGMIAELKVNQDAMKAMSQRGYSTATDLADWLVRTLNMPFRDAHHVTGRIVVLAEEKACRLDELTLEDMQTVEPTITDAIFDVLSVEASVNSRTSHGGTAPEQVRLQIANAKERFLNG